MAPEGTVQGGFGIGLGPRAGSAFAVGASLLVLTGAGPVDAAPRQAPECRPAPTRTEEITTLGPRGELVLGSGARAVLSGVHWPEDAAASWAAADWLLMHRGRRLTVTGRGDPDRWGHIRIDAAPDDEATNLAGGLIAAGLAATDAGEGDTLCRPALLALERAARGVGRGIWRAGAPDVRDGAALREAAGRFIVAEGRLVGVGERPGRTYLDFVARGRDGLTVTVSKRTWRRLQERGLSAATLKGRLVRVRGVVEVGRGPILDIASADMIEVLDEERAPRR
ncbi:DNA-binding protein [uncultured Methylobacterium sp.]|uniref:DNA-binding protein n=1 Tax=uncultured Methylobacterium sp. TaxID=157278 RepID=UPI0035C986B0